MKYLRLLLFPFSILYGLITSFRNFLFDKGILKSHSFDLPIIAVGNLSVGGTGKTPQIEYLIRLLSQKYKLATLSRGYKRKSEGFVLANSSSQVSEIGDEPFQFHQKFKNIAVAVDANRRNGIEQLQQIVNPEIILLDDAFQHRKVKAGFYILLTAYNDLYADDFLLPAGNLRESRIGAERASVVVVTKCPQDLSEKERNIIERKLQLETAQKLFFTTVIYDNFVFSEKSQISIEEIKLKPKMIVAGIAKPKPFYDFLGVTNNDEIITFPDHHDFSEKNIQNIENKLDNKILITTEKDYVRLKGKISAEKLFYLPIKIEFLFNGEQFDETIKNYVRNSTRNSSIHSR
ncbi:tetraacyldisaccharide 4'-kinase [Flavobacterium sp. NST-5]|uniref:Tetraacyldisaccharide 4'-kinase n=1 Tax=Flavobacterium ichthyis TaxID=2698827 RepID=A0ABW9Z746_9FLAO|nr:tetraacyldisaccharide 4'-kinase [Flavobacterium ichthyis]NBL64494.1 tetraacyldisaccharide 4'-kinase [Flavobacterium ichthyis]